LSKIVGDPLAPESKWLAACALAGDKPLVGKDGWALRFAGWILTIIACLGVLFAICICYPTTLIACANAAWFTNGIHPDLFLRDLKLPDVVGLFVSFFSAISFLICFLATSHSWKKVIMSSAASAAGIITFACGYTLLGAVPAVILATLAALGTNALGYAGSALKDALPKSLLPHNLIRATLSFLWLPTLFMIYVIQQAILSSNTTPTPFGDASVGELSAATYVLGYCVSGASFALSWASKGRSLKGCATLALMLHSPLMFGLSFSAIACLFGAVLNQPDALRYDTFGNTVLPSAWSTYGVKAGTLLLGTALVGVFCYLGALAGTAKLGKSKVSRTPN
jgi:hypothetical protein